MIGRRFHEFNVAMLGVVAGIAATNGNWFGSALAAVAVVVAVALGPDKIGELLSTDEPRDDPRKPW